MIVEARNGVVHIVFTLARTRHAIARERHPLEVRVFSLGFAHRRFVAPIHPGWDRIVAARGGSGLVRFGGGLGVLDAAHAYRIGESEAAEIDARPRLDLRIAYVRAPARPVAAVAMTALARELIERIVTRGWLDPSSPADARLIRVVADELAALATLERPMALAFPRDARARRVAEACATSDALRPATDLAGLAGCSPRTLERAFVRETGLGIAAWQRRVRLLAAAATLGAGTSVTNAALDAGYAGTSAFITAFRRAFGVTPVRFANTDG